MFARTGYLVIFVVWTILTFACVQTWLQGRGLGGWGGRGCLDPSWSEGPCVMLMSCDTVYANRRTQRPRGQCQASSALWVLHTHCTGCAVTTGLRHIIWPLPVKLFVSLWDYQVICKVTLCHHANLHFCIVVVSKHASQYFSHRVVGGLHLLPWIWADLWLPCTQ